MTTTQPASPSSSGPPGVDAALIAARLDRIPTGRAHVALAGKLGVGTFFDGFDALSIAVVLTVITQTLGVGLAEAGFIVSAGYVGQLVGALVIGALSDRIGRRRAFAASLAVFGLLSLACALAWSAESLLVFRLLQGIGLGAEVPVAATLINEFAGARRRGRFVLLYQVSFAWGLFFAPLVALAATSVAGPALGWRVLLGVGALPLLVAVWSWFTVPESPRWLATRGRLAEADAIVTRLEERAGPLSEPTPAASVPDVPVRLGELFSGPYRRRSATLFAIWFLAFVVSYGAGVWLPTIYIRIGGLPPSASLALTVVGSAVGLVVSYFTACSVDRIGRRRLLVSAFVVMAAGALFGLVAVGGFGLTSWPWLFSSGCVITIGTAVPSMALYLYTGELYPTRMRGWATSACSSMARFASILTPLVISVLLAAGSGGAVFGVLAVAALAAGVVMFVAGPETAGRPLETLST